MNKIYQYRPTLYFVLAFAVTWINGFILAAQSSQGAEKNLLHLLLAYMGPLIAALFMMYVFADKPFRADFRRRIFDLRLIDKRFATAERPRLWWLKSSPNVLRLPRPWAQH